MDTKAILSYSRQLFHRYKGRAVNITKRILPQRKMLMFAFGGRAHYWVGIGSGLYSSEKVFRDYIQKCDSIIQDIGGNSILINFEKKAKSDFFEDESNVIFTLTSIQIALFECLKSKGILPNAVMGVSLGEIAAAYAAGGVSCKDAMKIALSAAYISRHEKKEFVFLYLQTSLSKAKEILKESPVPLSAIYEVNEQNVLACCHKDDQDEAGQFLSSRSIAWHAPFKTLAHPYHTNFLLKHEKAIKDLTETVCPQPLQCDFYSSVSGARLPEGSIIENDFWFQMFHTPLWTYSVLQQIASNYRYLSHIGPAGFSESHLASKHFGQSIGAASFYTVKAEVSESELFSKTVRQLRRLQWLSSSLLKYKDNKADQFLQKLNFNDPTALKNPLLYLNYLQSHGKVHFIPQQNEWFVLDYTLADYILKTPEIFSSTIHQEFDNVLFGADPPSHTVVRSLMQPLFTPQRFNAIAQHTSAKANGLLEELKQKKEFNFVDEFSIPLSQTVFAKFMGLTEKEEAALQNAIGQNPYGLAFFNDLKAFSTDYLKNLRTENKDTSGSVLLGHVKDGTITFEDAVSLVRLLCVAGTVTTSILMSSAILLLSQNPDLLPRVREDEQVLAKFIEECLRLEAPESEVRRITTREVELNGQIVPKGAVIVLKVNAMNRDPNYFDRPDNIDFNRPVKKHLSFGGGYHFCLGAGIARIEAKAAIKTILERFAFLRIDQEKIEYFPSQHFRALQKLMIISED